jgi:hypothetical protein
MTAHQFADRDLRCATCGDGFIFTAGEQELYRLRGIPAQPSQCPDCTRNRALYAAARGSRDDRSGA